MATSFLCTPSAGLPTLPSSSLNLLPFHLKFNGPAPISTYFQPRDIPAPRGADDVPAHLASEGSEASRETIRVAAFRGRRVQAYTSAIPEGYIGLLLAAPPVPTAATVDVPTTTRATTRVESLKVVSEGQEDASGLRRSPRKRKAGDVQSLSKPLPRAVKKKPVKKISLDSDSEDDEGEGEKEAPAGEAVKEEEDGEAETQGSAIAKVEVEEQTQMDVDTTEAAPSALQEDSIAIVDASIKDESLPATPLINDPSNPFLDNSASASALLDTERLQPVARTLKPVATFSSFTIWSPDGPLDPGRDEYVRALGEWMTLGQELHKSVL